MVIYVRAILSTSFVIMAACHNSNHTVSPPPAKSPQHPSGNFVLYVTNQSGHRPEVDIAITLDGQCIVSGTFHKHCAALETPCNHVRGIYQFRLSPGEHVLIAVSTNGAAQAEKTFTVVANHWAAVSYFYSPGGKSGIPIAAAFTIDVKEEPIFFD